MKKGYRLYVITVIFLLIFSCGNSDTTQSPSLESNTRIDDLSNQDITYVTIYSKRDSTIVRDSIILKDTIVYRDSMVYNNKKILKDSIVFKNSIILKDSIIYKISDSLNIKDSLLLKFKDSVTIRDSVIVKDSLVIVRDTILDTVFVDRNINANFNFATIFDTVIVNTVNNGSYDAKIIVDTVKTSSKLSKYGGWLDKNVGATGYFYVKQIDGVWYFVDPEGYLFYSTGVTSVEKGGDINLPNDLKNNGINCMGNWSDESIDSIPFSPHYSFLSKFANTSSRRDSLVSVDVLPLFDSDFDSFIDANAYNFVQKYIGNSWVIGYYVENEIPFHHIDINEYLKLPKDDANYIATVDWIDKNGVDINSISDSDNESFQAYIASIYTKTVNSALKKYDPNHLNIGCRIHASVKWSEKLVSAIGENVDVLSINFYSRWQPTTENMDMWLNSAKVPFLISEFYTKADDTGLDNSDGAGWEVATQQDRAYHFYNMALTLMSHPGSVGWTWFRYIDKNGSNKGVVNQDYQWYTTLVNAMRNIGVDRYNLREYLINN